MKTFNLNEEFEILIKEYNYKKMNIDNILKLFDDLNNIMNTIDISIDDITQLFNNPIFLQIIRKAYRYLSPNMNDRSIYNITDNNLLITCLEYYCDINNITFEDINDIEIPNYSPNNYQNIYLEQINSIPILTQAEEKELFIKYKNGDEEAKNTLIERNLRLVVAVAYQYNRRYTSYPLIDLITEGNHGLIKAIEKYDLNKGNKFSTYAVWWIRQVILRLLEQDLRKLKIPSHLTCKIIKYQRVVHNLQDKLLREPTIKEIADELDITEYQVIQLQHFSKDAVSLNESISDDDDDDAELIRYISSDAPTPEEEYMESSKREYLLSLIENAGLTAREMQLIKYRYGFIDGKYHTLDNVGKLFNLTRERIRQMEGKAL